MMIKKNNPAVPAHASGNTGSQKNSNGTKQIIRLKNR